MPAGSDPPLLMVIDDDHLVRRSLVRALSMADYRIVEADSARHALDLVPRVRPDLIILDIVMPSMSGGEFLTRLGDRHDCPILVVSGRLDLTAGWTTAQHDRVQLLSKPIAPSHLHAAILGALREPANHSGRKPSFSYGSLMSSSPAMQAVFEQLRTLEGVLPRMVLVTGESGTGKELVANALRERLTPDDPLVEIDCTALPHNLVESTLFGHEVGAFTDASTRHKGLLQLARGGVAFLDEVGELPLQTQAKLLRCLEDRVFKRVGGTENIPLEAVVVAATNRDLAEEVRVGRFRADLYYRLAVVPIHLPPLRDRREDIEPLAYHFLDTFSAQFGRDVTDITEDAMERMVGYDWPGNIRQLRNVIERMVIFAGGEVLDTGDLPAVIRRPGRHSLGDEPVVLPLGGLDFASVERSLIEQALAQTQGHQQRAAELLGLSRYELRTRLRRLEIDPSAYRG